MRNALDLWSWNDGFTPALVLTPACDVEETATHYRISLDMPGIAKDAIQIELVDDRLVVAAERNWEKTEDGASRLLSERSFGRFHRAFQLGKSVQRDKIEATYRDGVLRIELAKADEAKPRQIQVH